MIYITTERLLLRQWRQSDLEPFAKLNADPRVREFFPSVQTREQSDNSAKILLENIAKYGYGLWAVSLKDTDEFIGFIGIQDIPFESHFTPAVEIGWRLSHEYWGKGYATEGAKAVLEYAFNELHMPEIVALTSIHNKPSQNVMQKIGMHHDPKDDFDHPRVEDGHWLKRHVLYRMSCDEWKKPHSASN
ncbi:MAG: GNAT family N-acetyltransferase [Chlamydiales bacterium]|nr:GNAT family N-acetyltransferase [Chlamydiales bacterium]